MSLKLTIDNFDGLGARDYTALIDSANPPRILRRLNRRAELRVTLLGDTPEFIVPAGNARVLLVRADDQHLFTGYLAAVPDFEYLGWRERGPVFRYQLTAISDELLLDRKPVPNRPPFVARPAGNALAQLTEDLLPNAIDKTAVASLDIINRYRCDQDKTWSQHAAAIAMRARASYRVIDGRLTFAPVGSAVHVLNETHPASSRDKLRLQQVAPSLNDLTLLGAVEPQAYVTDYFVGNDISSRFYLSQDPFHGASQSLVEEEYKGAALDPTRWSTTDPASAVSVAGGKLQIAGGTGVDSATLVRFAEKLELGGAYILQHGDVSFTASSNGVFGGLYANAISMSSCLAGFRVVPSGSASSIQALINGQATGAAISTQPGHRYVLTTRLYASETYRCREAFHSSLHPAGVPYGGQEVPSDLRIILEVHDIDPANPGSANLPSIVLYDGVIAGAPAFCTYVLVNAIDLHCSIAFTRLVRAAEVLVRSCPPEQSFRTRLVGSLSEGAECRVLSDPALQFFPQYAPHAGEQISVKYRSVGRAMTRITDPLSAAAIARGADNGIRGGVRHLTTPAASTSADCDNAALAILDDASRPGWRGEYQTWSDFLPAGSDDVFPGDLLQVNAPERGATFDAVVREVEIEVADLRDEHSRYTLRFADDAADPLGFEFDSAASAGLPGLEARSIAAVPFSFLPELTNAAIVDPLSTMVTIDAGLTPAAGYEIEVRSTDYGWGLENDRNLLGRFSSRTFMLPRLAASYTYFLRQHDSSTPPRYSRYSAALHIDSY